MMTAVGVLICIEDAISWGELFVRAAFQTKKQKAEQTNARKSNAIQAMGFELVNKLARTFSSKMNAAIVSSNQPIAIDQKVIVTLEKRFVFFRVMITDNARLDADARVRTDPMIISELSDTWLELVAKSKSEPPTIPKMSEIHFRAVNFSLRRAFPRPSTINGEMSMMAAERLDVMNFRPASCKG